MMRRHELREQVFRLLFCVEFHSEEEMPAQARLYIQNTEVITKEDDAEYISERFESVRDKIAEIDKLINERTTGWDTTRMGKVELTVLRLAIYEIMFDEEIPTNVSINEAVELAKTYGQENSGSFVNAILAKFVE